MGFIDLKEVYRLSASPVTFTPQGEMVISIGRGNKLRISNCNGCLISDFSHGHNGIIYCVTSSIHLSSQYIVSGGEDGTIRLWDLQGNLIANPFQGHEGAVFSVAVSPAGQYIVSGGEDGTIRLWDLRGNLIAKYIREDGYIFTVSFSPNGEIIVTGGYHICLYNLKGDLIAQPFRGHEGYVYSAIFNPDGQCIVSGGEDGKVCLWDLKGNPISEPFLGHKQAVYSVAYNHNGQFIVSGSINGEVVTGSNGPKMSGEGEPVIRVWRGGWLAWLKVCCDRLRYHPVFTNPESIEDPEQREIAIAARKTCKKYVWNKAEDSAE